MFGLVTPRQLRTRGIVGMNRRNHAVIQAYNDRENYPGVDDKLKTKILAKKAKIPVPKLIGVIRYQYQVKDLLKLLEGVEQFVIKPTQGCAGRGIVVILGRDGEQFIKPSGERISLLDMNRHISNILSGLYSLGGRVDVAMVESCIHFTDAFEGYSYQGVPDVRIIVFKGYPIMAMMRLSTSASDGKANLHQGAVGVGIDIVTGKARKAVQFNRPVSHHPDTEKPFDKLVIPQWDEHVAIATRCYEMTGLGYFGADVVLDQDLGPLILELNARPGLAIQTANGIGLQSRISEIESLEDDPLPSPDERIGYVMEHFMSNKQNE